MDDADLDFAAMMEGAGVDAARLEAVEADELKPGDTSLLIASFPITIGEMRVLRSGYQHLREHQCEWGASVLLQWATVALITFDPFLVQLDRGSVGDDEDDQRREGPSCGDPQ